MSTKLTKNITVTLLSGRTVTAEVTATIVHDPSYGADADGNRGVSMDFVDVIEFDPPMYNDYDEPLTLDERNEADELLCDAAESDDWEEDNSPNYDWDNYYNQEWDN